MKKESTRATLSRQIVWGLLITAASALSLAADSGQADHLGPISAEALLRNYPAFAAEYGDYSPGSAELAHMAGLAGKEVTVLFGTWCHDSEREVPRLLKLLDQSGVVLEQLTLFAVDRSKSDPDGFARRFQLRYTPTIVVSEQGRELARITERPEQSLAGDLDSQLRP